MTETTLQSGDYDAIVQDAKIANTPSLFSNSMGDQAKITFELLNQGETLVEWFYMGVSSFKGVVEAILGRPRILENFNLKELIGKKCVLTIKTDLSEGRTNYKIVQIKPAPVKSQVNKPPVLRVDNAVDFSIKIIMNDGSGAKDPLPFIEVSNAMPTWVDKKNESIVLLLDTLKKINQALETQNRGSILLASREALVVFEFVIVRDDDPQSTADAHFHKATIYVRHADQCDPRHEADVQLNYLRAAENSIGKALSDPRFVHPNFRSLHENIKLRMDKHPYSIG